ncbi:prepilin-type N-terminal cleavage/methylation domain-containing protein, partial [Thalassobaculum salexigens]
MCRSQRQGNAGFTLIEVMIVLVIVGAGLYVTMSIHDLAGALHRA